MHLKHLSFAQVTDIYGFRVIVPTITDCYTALGVLHQMYKPVPGKFMITSPLPNSMATSLCTPRWWGHLESTSNSRCARTRCM